ncbi:MULTISPECIES: conjugal transfer protein [Streptococcus]|uniref:conjugal transfer protein n=1 Tax=Streptococcus TaxID=1301 RepID=UPI0019616730|nr:MULTISPECIES: conjugal transfer protein [Streptococcus]MBM7192437.1 conjugal transfer protein [Streptococcus suis]MBY0720569.1 conjugal transfer protein [Streptococcus sp. 2018110]MCO8184433.1 conjugal transfer protein [Streptococcus suis]MCO8216002.1 conjugal transfer protein [Streptococcus suis]MCO8224420.1 conjugal transfer protein [Streptococcus suis]
MVKILKSKKKKEVTVRRFSQKRYNRLFLGGLIVFFSLSCLMIVTNLMKADRKEEPIQQIVADDRKEYRLENYLNNFVYYYFNFSEDGETQSSQIEKLNSFYADGLTLSNQGYLRQPSVLNTYRLLYLDKEKATYLVSYTVTIKEEGKETKQEFVTEFTVPYKEVEGKYYVSDLPYFETVKSSQYEIVGEEEKKKLEPDNVLNEEQNSQLKDFLTLFFTNYVSSQENLNLIANNIPVLAGTRFKSLDWAYLDDSDSNQLKVYAQVTFDTLGTTRSENFSFTIIKKDDGFYVEKMKHGIPEKYKKEEKK